MVHAISVAEVVTPAEAESAPLARDLMVALVRAGVTATCSGADKPRYGHLEVDSNLPDTRIALGGPERNAFTAAVLSAADPVYTAELRRQLETQGEARIFIPASAPLATEWVPDADLRGARALPVLVVAGNGDDALRDADSRADRRPRGRRDRGLAAGADRGCAVRGAHRRIAQPRCAELRRGGRRDPAHLVDAVVLGLAVGGVDHP